MYTSKKVSGFTAVAALMSAASFGYAAQVTTSGQWVVGPVGSAGPAALNSSGSVSFNAGSGSDSVTGVGAYSINQLGNQVCVTLRLTNFTWSVATPGTQTLTVTLTQDVDLTGFAVSAPGATAQHVLNGSYTAGAAGQLLRITGNATHESTATPAVTHNPGGTLTSGPGTVGINRSTPSANVTVTGSIYTITSTYVFTINAGSSSMSVNLPDSAVASACMTVTEVPTANCDSIDFNHDGSVFDPIDIDAFLSVFSEGPCIPAEATCGDIDFNNDTSIFDPCDIDSFLLQYSEGPCRQCGQ